MRAEPIILLVLLPFLALLRWLYLRLSKAIADRRMTLASAMLRLWGVIVFLPWLSLYFYVPLLNLLFSKFPVLQTTAWDVGLAMSLWVGMAASYVIGGLTGVAASVRLARTAKLRD